MIRDDMERILMRFGVSRSKAEYEVDTSLGVIAAFGMLIFAAVVTVTDLKYYWEKTLISGGIAVLCILLARNKLAVVAGCLGVLAVRFIWALLITH